MQTITIFEWLLLVLLRGMLNIYIWVFRMTELRGR